MQKLSDKKILIDYLLLAVAVAVIYGRLAGYDFLFSHDDNLNVVENATIRGFSLKHVHDAFALSSLGQYNPLALLSYMLDYTLWGMWPGGYHLTNILIHGVNGLLVYRLTNRWYGDRLLCLVAAAFFLFHPVQVESVAWISERKGLLAVFFFLLSWEWYCCYREAVPGKGRRVYILSIVAYLLSLLAKPSTVIMPAILVLYDLCFSRRSQRPWIVDKIPYLLAAVVFSAVVMLNESPEHGGGRIGYHGGSLLATFLTMLPVFCSYMGMLVWPVGLSVEYWPQIHRTFDSVVAISALILGVGVMCGFKLYRIDRRMGFWVMFFWIGLGPVSQVVPLLLMKFDHYLYLPLLGVAVLVGSGVASVRDRLGVRYVRPLYLLVAIWLAALSVTSFNRSGVWRDSLTLWSDASVKTPHGYRVWYFLGESYLKAGRKDAAVKAYERSLLINPTSTDVYLALGDLYTELGEPEKGYAQYRRLTEINPKYVKGWAALGTYYMNRGDYVQADALYSRALTLQPDFMHVVSLRGALALREGHLDQARALLLQVEMAGWSDPENAYYLACVEYNAGQFPLALEWVEEALQRGYRKYDTLAKNRDLSRLWESPHFLQLLQQYFPQEHSNTQ